MLLLARDYSPDRGSRPDFVSGSWHPNIQIQFLDDVDLTRDERMIQSKAGRLHWMKVTGGPLPMTTIYSQNDATKG